MNTDTQLLAPDQAVLDSLREVIDPEIGINIVDLGLVYFVDRSKDSVRAEITLTSRACPLGEHVVAEVRDALTRDFPGCSDVIVRLVWEPAWHPDLVTEQGRRMLGLA